MTPARELAARLRADGTPLSIEAAEWLEATQAWLAQENAGKASALTVCAHCWGPFTNDEVRSHVQSCPSNPLVQEIEKLRRHRRYLNAVAIWFAFNEPEVLEPDWVDPQGWSNCEPMIDEESVDECERLGWNIESREAAGAGGDKP